MSAITDIKKVCRDQLCVATTGACWPNVPTFGCRGDMSPTCWQLSQPRAAGVGRIWHEKEKCPLSEDVSRSGLRPNVAREWCPWRVIRRSCHAADIGKMWQKMMPLVGGLCHAVDFNKMWPKLCPLSEDFVTHQTLTKCGPNCAPHWRSLSRRRLWPNVVQNVALVGGLCLTVDFNQMWSKYVPLVGGLCHTADFNQMWSKHVPLDEWLRFATEFDHIWINNVLIIKESRYQTNRS